jgi:hypothetical protein
MDTTAFMGINPQSLAQLKVNERFDLLPPAEIRKRLRFYGSLFLTLF